MAADSLSPQIRQFIERYIHSVEQLEVLCILTEQPPRPWSIPEIFHRIQSSEKSIAHCLEQFRSGELAVSDKEGTFRFSFKEQGSFETVHAVVKAYRDRRVSVIECIYKKPSDPIQDFADAFRLRKEK